MHSLFSMAWRARTNSECGHIICKAKSIFSWQPTTAGGMPRKAVSHGKTWRYSVVYYQPLTPGIFPAPQFGKWRVNGNAQQIAKPRHGLGTYKSPTWSGGDCRPQTTAQRTSHNSASSEGSRGNTESPSLNTSPRWRNLTFGRWVESTYSKTVASL